MSRRYLERKGISRLPFALKIFEDFLRFDRKVGFHARALDLRDEFFLRTRTTVSSSRAYFTITTLIRETRPAKRESSRRQSLVIHLIDLSAGSNLARAEHDDCTSFHNCSSPDDLKVTESNEYFIRIESQPSNLPTTFSLFSHFLQYPSSKTFPKHSPRPRTRVPYRYVSHAGVISIEHYRAVRETIQASLQPTAPVIRPCSQDQYASHAMLFLFPFSKKFGIAFG